MRKRKGDSGVPAEFFKNAKRGTDGMPDQLVAGIRRFRGKQNAPTKIAISIRIDQETVEAFRTTGKGWQSRMNVALGRAAKRILAER